MAKKCSNTGILGLFRTLMPTIRADQKKKKKKKKKSRVRDRVISLPVRKRDVERVGGFAKIYKY